MLRKSLIVIVLLLLLVAFGVNSSAQADGTPTPDHMDMAGTPEGDQHEEGASDADHNPDHGPRIDANGAAIKIVDPKDGEVLDRPTVIVRVETTNWPLGEAGHHWHVYVNGKEQGMSLDKNPALQVRDLQPGENIIEAVLSNELHQELTAIDKIIVRFDAGSAAVAAPALSTSVVFVLLGIAVVVVAILGVGYALTRKKA